MVARQNAEAAGIIRNRFVKAELGRKIGDRFFDRAAGAGLSVGVLALQIFLNASWTCFSSRRKVLSCETSSSRACRESCSMRTGL